MKCVFKGCRRVVAGALVLVGVLLAPALCLADDAGQPKKGVTIEGITEYRLDNGVQVLLFPDRSTANVTVNLTVLVGSRHEGYGETGMAHLLEHMVFKGTPTVHDVPKALRDHGARFNGSTWVDRTNYYETMPASDENLEFALRLEADRLVNSYVKREDLVSEMTVVRNEFEMGENSPENILSQRMMAVAYEWHNYGKSTIGNRSDIERVPIDNLQAFYRRFYQPDNVMLVIAGNFDEKKALAFVTKYFGVLKRPERKLDETYTEEPPQDGERTVVLRRVGKVGVVGVVYHICAGSHEDFAAVEVLDEILTMQPSGRLYQALVTSKKANSVTSSAFGWHDPGALEITAEVDRKNSLETVRDTMLDTLEKLPTEKFTTEEVDRARAKLLKARELLMTDSNRIGVTLSEWGSKGDWRLFFLHRDRLEKVTPADVSRVAARYLQRSNRTVGLYIPSEQSLRAPIPETPKVAELLKDYKGGKGVAAGEAFEPTPENIEKHVQRSVLPGGIKLAVLPKKSRGESVVVNLSLHYGNPESLKGITSATQFLGSLMSRGTKQHTRQQLEDELDRLKARATLTGLLGQLNGTIECKRENLPAVLTLFREVLREPTFPQDEFDILKRQARDQLEKSLVEPSALAVRAVQRKMAPYAKDDVRYTPTIPESIERLEAVTVEQVRKLYTEQLGGEAGEVVVVGDFDPDSTRKQLGELFTDWKAATPYQRIERPAQTDINGEKIVIETPDKANAFYFAGQPLAIKDSEPDYAPLEVANFLFGGGSLSSRLGNRVRQKDGLSYGVASRFTADALDRNGRFMMFAICNPANVEKVDKAIAEELDKMLKEGAGDKEVEEAKKAYLAEQKVGRSKDSELASELLDDLFAGRTFAYQGELEKRIASLSTSEVNDAFRKYIAAKKLVIVHAGDFKPKGGSEK
jgi:zinc protease